MCARMLYAIIGPEITKIIKLDDKLGRPFVILGGLGCTLIRREGQRFFSSLVNEPPLSRWAAMEEARSILLCGGRIMCRSFMRASFSGRDFRVGM